jgi:hypothetical protein
MGWSRILHSTRIPSITPFQWDVSIKLILSSVYKYVCVYVWHVFYFTLKMTETHRISEKVQWRETICGWERNRIKFTKETYLGAISHCNTIKMPKSFLWCVRFYIVLRPWNSGRFNFIWFLKVKKTIRVKNISFHKILVNKANR